jgi:hypothetical protein
MKEEKPDPRSWLTSLWPASADGRRLAVSLSRTEPRPVIGHIINNQDETWSIEGDATIRKFGIAEAAARTLIIESQAKQKPAPPELKND